MGNPCRRLVRRWLPRTSIPRSRDHDLEVVSKRCPTTANEIGTGNDALVGRADHRKRTPQICGGRGLTSGILTSLFDARLKPSAVRTFIDKVQIWFCMPIDRVTIDRLRKECGRGGIYVEWRRARFDRRFRQRAELRQPSDNVLQWLSNRPDILVNRAEFALDFIFESPAERDDAIDFLRRHVVRRWHGRKQKVRLAGPFAARATRYDAGRWAPNAIAFYPERFSRVTGELYCVHFEWRVNGATAVRRLGLSQPADLGTFDHRAFWKRRLLLLDVDGPRLGRLLSNKYWGETSRKSRVATHEMRRAGHVILNSYVTIQELLDEWCRKVRAERFTVPLPTEPWLPPTDDASV